MIVCIACMVYFIITLKGVRDYETEEWTDLVDRGGLTHVDDMLFDMFVAMEMEIRRHIGTSSETSSMRDRAIHGILNNDDVKFYWSMVASGDWAETESTLLRMIVNHWVTIRGFSYTGAFMERYKQKNKKTVQKSKGLRKKLLPQK